MIAIILIDPVGRIALVGASYSEIRDVMIEGQSGILNVHKRAERPEWQVSKRKLEWPNGAMAQIFSAQDPESLRGPQFAAAWCDELAKWVNLQATWDMLQFCLRLGNAPRQVITTTPRPVKVLKDLLADKRTIISRSSTMDNHGHLATGFLERLIDLYGGTRLGRQEINGELIEDRSDGLWKRREIERFRTASAPPMQRIVVAIDPPVSANENSDACGIIAVGMDANAHYYVLTDHTQETASPMSWAVAAVKLYHAFSADCLVAETNQGGDLVEVLLHQVDPTLPVRQVRATRGKWLRAEPVALLYERGLVRHVGHFPDLEDQMCDFGPGGLSDGSSPDRLDALVWGITELMRGNPALPRIRKT